MKDDTPRYMASTSSWAQRARSPTGGQRHAAHRDLENRLCHRTRKPSTGGHQAERSKRRHFSSSGHLDGLPKEAEMQEHMGFRELLFFQLQCAGESASFLWLSALLDRM